MTEFEQLAEAITHANRNGMLVEFVYTYGIERATGHESNEAIRHALREWDL